MEVINLNTSKEIIQFLKLKNHDLNQKIKCHIEILI